jgi:hypothetical protein
MVTFWLDTGGQPPTGSGAPSLVREFSTRCRRGVQAREGTYAAHLTQLRSQESHTAKEPSTPRGDYHTDELSIR